MEMSKDEETVPKTGTVLTSIDMNDGYNIDVVKKEEKVDHFDNNDIISGNIQNDDFAMKEEIPKPYVITVRIKKKKGVPRKANPQMLFTPELFHSVFGFSIFDCQDSEWRDVIKKKEGTLHFRSNGTRLQDTSDMDVKPLRLAKPRASKKSVPKKLKIENINNVAVEYSSENVSYDTKNSKFKYNTGKYMEEVVIDGTQCLKCLLCGVEFQDDVSIKACTRVRLRKHIETVHFRIRRHGCNQCNARFKSIASLQKHIDSIHLKLRPYKCKICGKGFAAPNTLLIHTTTHSEKGRFECTICGKHIRHKNTFQDHMNMHSGEVKYTCGICQKTFLYKKSFRHHLQLHSSEYTSKCSVCDKLFKSDSQRKKHENNHSTLYQCSICDKVIATRGGLRMHIANIHYSDGEKVFQCSHCQSKFKTENMLKTHVQQLHTLNIQCNHCQATFPNKSRLRYHMMSNHNNTGFRPWKCDLCDKRFIKEAHVKRHMKTHDRIIVPRDLSCTECGKLFKSENLVKNHEKNCTRTCKYCKTRLATKYVLRDHKKICKASKVTKK